jgi:hypothetical protein
MVGILTVILLQFVTYFHLNIHSSIPTNDQKIYIIQEPATAYSTITIQKWERRKFPHNVFRHLWSYVVRVHSTPGPPWIVIEVWAQETGAASIRVMRRLWCVLNRQYPGVPWANKPFRRLTYLGRLFLISCFINREMYYPWCLLLEQRQFVD